MDERRDDNHVELVSEMMTHHPDEKRRFAWFRR